MGLRDDDGLPYYYFQGTSYSPECFGKNINKNAPQGATWCPEIGGADKSFLEVDLGKQYLLCGVSTQGDRNGFTKSYKIELSADRIHWTFYQNNRSEVVCMVRLLPRYGERGICIQIILKSKLKLNIFVFHHFVVELPPDNL